MGEHCKMGEQPQMRRQPQPFSLGPQYPVYPVLCWVLQQRCLSIPFHSFAKFYCCRFEVRTRGCLLASIASIGWQYGSLYFMKALVMTYYLSVCLSGGWSSSHSILAASFQLVVGVSCHKYEISSGRKYWQTIQFSPQQSLYLQLTPFWHDTILQTRPAILFVLSGWPQCCRFRLSIVRCVNNENTSANFFCRQGCQTQISVLSVTQLCFSFVHGLSNLG